MIEFLLIMIPIFVVILILCGMTLVWEYFNKPLTTHDGWEDVKYQINYLKTKGYNDYIDNHPIDTCDTLPLSPYLGKNGLTFNGKCYMRAARLFYRMGWKLAQKDYLHSKPQSKSRILENIAHKYNLQVVDIPMSKTRN